jgi:hypothetical protein
MESLTLAYRNERRNPDGEKEAWTPAFAGVYVGVTSDLIQCV